ncbi:MAG TPA: dockerin type I repeat-containing protein, partial [Dehalococcoidia bacterium]
PTHQSPVNGQCATITPTPTSQRPFGASLALMWESPARAVSGQKKTWVFEIENVGSQHGCQAHQVDFSVTLSGLADSQIYETSILDCRETTEVTVSSVVTALPGDTIAIVAHATAGASQIIGQFSESEDVMALGDFNCDGAIDSIDAALILQVNAGMAVPLPCTGDGDVNHDGELDALDALLILQFNAGLITAFP